MITVRLAMLLLASLPVLGAFGAVAPDMQPSALQVVRNYANAVTQSGGKQLYENKDLADQFSTPVLKDGVMYVQAGAGIVADSVPEREHAEVLAKGAALAAAVELAQEGL